MAGSELTWKAKFYAFGDEMSSTDEPLYGVPFHFSDEEAYKPCAKPHTKGMRCCELTNQLPETRDGLYNVEME
jgi:hypothetical protein